MTRQEAEVDRLLQASLGPPSEAAVDALALIDQTEPLVEKAIGAR